MGILRVILVALFLVSAPALAVPYEIDADSTVVAKIFATQFSFLSDGDTGFRRAGPDSVYIETGGTARMTWGATGNVYVLGRMGIGTARPGATLDIVGTTPDLHIRDNTANSFGGALRFLKSRGTEGTPTIVSSGDEIATTLFRGYDGAAYITAASIRAFIDGTPGTNDMPGRIEFLVAPDGSNVDVLAMVLKNTGWLGRGIASPLAHFHNVGSFITTSRLAAGTTDTTVAFHYFYRNAADNIPVGYFFQDNATATAPVLQLKNDGTGPTIKALGNGGFIVTRSVSVTQNDSISLGPVLGMDAGTQNGMLGIFDENGDTVAEFYLRGDANTTYEVLDHFTTTSVTRGEANSINVYYSTGAADYVLENKRATQRFALSYRGF